MKSAIRHDWSVEEVLKLYEAPLLELVYRSAGLHRQFHDPSEVQVCKLISIKTGACPEDCSYCSQSARYRTEIKPEPLMDKCKVREIAVRAKDAGVTRVCMGAAWREVKDNRQFGQVLEMVKDVTALDMEVCCTLGMLTEEQAKRLEEAGLYAYNHNIDTSEEYYETIITTRKFADRLRTLENVRKTHVTICSGGIIGLGESAEDRASMLCTLARMNPHPESVPINILAKVPGTPLAQNPDVPPWDIVRMVAIARLLMPASQVRLSAGRSGLSVSDQALCFLAGANSIFSTDDGHMLTVAAASPNYDADRELFKVLGLTMRPPFKHEHAAREAEAAEPTAVGTATPS